MTDPERKSVQALSIRAAVLRKRGRLKIETLEMEGPREDEILVRLVASGICKTDIDICDDWDDTEVPVVLGHEGAGVVERVGSRVKKIRRGDHVVLSYQSCGRCGPCRRGRSAGCERLMEANFGFARLDGSNALERSGVRVHFFGQSSFATHTLATERNLVKVDDELPLELLAPLGCGMQTGAGTVLNSLKVVAGESIAIFGVGSVGLAAVMAARIVGAEPIIAVDTKRKRLDLAMELGATHAILNRRTDLPSRIARITGRGVAYVLEITGIPSMYRSAVECLHPRGVVALFSGESVTGSLPGGKRAVSIIQGDSVPQRFIPRLIELYLEGRFPFDRLVKFYDFAAISKAMEDSRKGRTVKPVLRIDHPPITQISQK